METGYFYKDKLHIYDNELYPNDHSGLNGRKFTVSTLAVRQ